MLTARCHSRASGNPYLACGFTAGFISPSLGGFVAKNKNVKQRLSEQKK